MKSPLAIRSSISILLQQNLARTNGFNTIYQRRNNTNNSNPNQAKLVKALYRNLLRWCEQTEKLTNNRSFPIPLEPIPPPVTLLPYSNIDVYLLSDLEEYVRNKNKEMHTKPDSVSHENTLDIDNKKFISYISSLLPPRSTVEKNRLTLHVQDLESIRKSIQIGFRMSGRGLDEETFQKNIALGFDTLRNLKEHIQPLLEKRLKERQQHMNRDGIYFSVGQGKLFLSFDF